MIGMKSRTPVDRVIVSAPQKRDVKDTRPLTEEPAPHLPLHPAECRKGKAVRQRSGKHGRCEGDEDAELGPEIGSDAERERDKGRAIALRVADEANLRRRARRGLNVSGRAESERRDDKCTLSQPVTSRTSSTSAGMSYMASSRIVQSQKRGSPRPKRLWPMPKTPRVLPSQTSYSYPP